MAATPTVHQVPTLANSDPIYTDPLTPRNGVITLFGFGTKIHVDRGHLVLKDGIADLRREARLPRVGHGLRRLIVIGSDGMVSLAALRWLADQNAAFVMLERDGSVLVATGPIRPSDARLRRAQALAHHQGAAVPIIRELIDRKLAGQEWLARDRLTNASAAGTITEARAALRTAETPDAIRALESQAALAYWSAWRAVPVIFPKNDLRRVPDHWRTFGTRQSPLSGSPRLAVNPPNTILNYLYAVLESESRLAAVALGLDPGIGVLHVDTDARDSLACDLMEPIRPQVDAYVLEWLMREPFRREWFFEQRDGTCRLMASFAVRLSETAPTWARAIAPVAERVAAMLWSTMRRPARQRRAATRLTQRHRREVKGDASLPVEPPLPPPPRVCRICGTVLRRGRRHCAQCAVSSSTEQLVRAAEQGRIAAQRPEAQERRSATQRRNALAQHAWKASDEPSWLTEQTYAEQIQPRLAAVTVSVVSSALGVSRPYAVDIRAGRRRPHPRHWLTLAKLVGISAIL